MWWVMRYIKMVRTRYNEDDGTDYAHAYDKIFLGTKFFHTKDGHEVTDLAAEWRQLILRWWGASWSRA